MQIDPMWLESVVPAALAGLISLASMAVVLRWWRLRLARGESEGMRARIAAAAPGAALLSEEPEPVPVSVPVMRHIPARARSHPGQRIVLASSFVGRDRTALPLD
ncbi:MAG: hypothetical protein K2X74_19210 [Acetobacteraceae bacterium]|nr:hypothetical protein [Acetobacteraceae bacterium]